MRTYFAPLPVPVEKVTLINLEEQIEIRKQLIRQLWLDMYGVLKRGLACDFFRSNRQRLVVEKEIQRLKKKFNYHPERFSDGAESTGKTSITPVLNWIIEKGSDHAQR
jgi:hypothetical protein